MFLGIEAMLLSNNSLPSTYRRFTSEYESSENFVVTEEDSSDFVDSKHEEDGTRKLGYLLG